VSFEDIKKKLEEGNSRYVKGQSISSFDESARSKLVETQSPQVIILSCADSRVTPEVLFDSSVGDLFVIRVAGNIVNKDILGSIEYAVENCSSKMIVVLGHESCGAVKAAIAGGEVGENLINLISEITPALKERSSIEENVKSNVQLVTENILKRSSFIKKSCDNKKLSILGAYYSLSTGKVEFL